MNELLFLELADFLKWVRKNRLAAAVEKLKADLIENPEAGDVIPGGSGLRKVRMAGSGRGKRGGYRVVYVLTVGQAVAVLIKGYAKNEKEDLTPDELKGIVRVIPTIDALARVYIAREVQFEEETTDGEE